MTYSFFHTVAKKREGALVALLKWLYDSWQDSDHYSPLDHALAKVCKQTS